MAISWQDIPIPELALQSILGRDGNPLYAVASADQKTGRTLVVIVSEDNGPNGDSRGIHASVTACRYGVNVNVQPSERKEVQKKVGIEPESITPFQDGKGIHLFESFAGRQAKL